MGRHRILGQAYLVCLKSPLVCCCTGVVVRDWSNDAAVVCKVTVVTVAYAQCPPTTWRVAFAPVRYLMAIGHELLMVMSFVAMWWRLAGLSIIIEEGRGCEIRGDVPATRCGRSMMTLAIAQRLPWAPCNVMGQRGVLAACVGFGCEKHTISTNKKVYQHEW